MLFFSGVAVGIQLIRKLLYKLIVYKVNGYFKRYFG